MVIKDPLLAEILRWGGGVRSLAAGFTRPTTPSSDSPLPFIATSPTSFLQGGKWSDISFPLYQMKQKKKKFFNILIINLFFFATI